MLVSKFGANRETEQYRKINTYRKLLAVKIAQEYIAEVNRVGFRINSRMRIISRLTSRTTRNSRTITTRRKTLNNNNNKCNSNILNLYPNTHKPTPNFNPPTIITWAPSNNTILRKASAFIDDK